MPDSDRTALETLCWLLDEAFEGDGAQSLLASLRGMTDAEWAALPPGAGRSIAEHVEHVAWAKWMYDDYAFGPATLRGDQPPLVPAGGASARPPEELLAWLREGHRRWMASIRALPDDRELDRERLTNWGERLPTRTLLRIMLLHDAYHAGEINHMRALLNGTDRWPY
jgi:hypothetical protein